MRVASLLIVVLGLGCRGESSGSGESKPAPSACEPGHADEHRKRYANVCRDAAVATDRLASIGGSATPKSALEGLRIVVSPIGVELRGETSTDPADIERLVSEEVEVSKRVDDSPMRFVLEIDRDTPMTLVDATARALLDLGLPDGVLALAAADRSPPAVHPEIYRRLAAEIENTSPDERATRIARALEPLVGDCTPLDEAFSAVAVVAPNERCAALTQPLADAFVSCDCPSTEPEIMTWIQVVEGADTPYVHAHAVRLHLAPTAPARTEKTWADFVASHRDGLAELEIPPAPK